VQIANSFYKLWPYGILIRRHELACVGVQIIALNDGCAATFDVANKFSHKRINPIDELTRFETAAHLWRRTYAKV
jgi:hypothetical protein